jgi:hypothetical protein
MDTDERVVELDIMYKLAHSFFPEFDEDTYSIVPITSTSKKLEIHFDNGDTEIITIGKAVDIENKFACHIGISTSKKILAYCKVDYDKEWLEQTASA